MCCYNFPQPHLGVTLEFELTLSVYASHSLALFCMLMNSPIIRVGFLGFFGRGWLRTDGSLLLLFWSLDVGCASVFLVLFVQLPECSYNACTCMQWRTDEKLSGSRSVPHLSLAYSRGK